MPTYSHYSSRIANASRAWQAACETDVSDWEKTAEFIIAMVATTDAHSGESAQFKLQWGVGQSPTEWNDLAATGAMKFGSSTVLVDCTSPIEEANQSGCHQNTLEDSHENEGDGTTVILDTTAKDNCVEAQFAINPADASDGETYSFRLYNITGGAALGVAGASIVIVAGATEHYQTVEDKAGLVDTAPTVWTAHKTVTDITGLVDSATTVKGMSQTASDITGLVDSVATVKKQTQTVSDIVGLVDSAVAALNTSQTVSDIVGLLDSVGVVHTPGGGTAHYQTITDLAGLLDSVTTKYTAGPPPPRRGMYPRHRVTIRTTWTPHEFFLDHLDDFHTLLQYLKLKHRFGD